VLGKSNVYTNWQLVYTEGERGGAHAIFKLCAVRALVNPRLLRECPVNMRPPSTAAAAAAAAAVAAAAAT